MDHLHPHVVRFSVLLAMGCATGLALWMWGEHGGSVYLSYLAGFALTCF